MLWMNMKLAHEVTFMKTQELIWHKRWDPFIPEKTLPTAGKTIPPELAIETHLYTLYKNYTPIFT